MDKLKRGVSSDNSPSRDHNDITSTPHSPKAVAVTKSEGLGFQTFLWAGGFVLLICLAYIFWPRTAPRLPTSASIPVSISTVSTPSPIPSTPIPTPTAVSFAPSTPTIPPGSVPGLVVPSPQGAGWATSLDGRSHFGAPNIHAGFFKGHIYYGALQFDLSEVPPGSTITYAALELTGLNRQHLAQGGTWQASLLDSAINASWSELTFQALRQAPVETTIQPALGSDSLAQGGVNVLPFGPEQLSILEQHLANGMVAFRLEGPTSGEDNLFTWDSGYRTGAVLETRPVLRLVIVPPEVPEYVIVTSTPTPENIITVAALAATATEMASAIGPNTPLPENWVTPVVVVPQPPPANAATASYQQAAATAEAFLFGSATPTPINVWTATPTPVATNVNGTPVPGESNIANASITGQFTASATLAPGRKYVIVTGVPTPENIITVAAMAATATKVADTIGTYTPVPANWITPIVVTAQPTPANAVTAAYLETVATAEAFLFGPATPTPVNMWTATPTPIFAPVVGQVATPFATFTPTAAPQPVPQELVGKIAFLSNRSGGTEPLRTPLVYVIDPDGSNLAVLTGRTFYDEAIARDAYSADQRFRAFIKDALRFDGKRVPTLHFYDYLYNAEDQITHFGAGFAWDPVWSPTREQIAFVSNDSRDDEIWVVDRNGNNLRRLTDTNEAYNAREIGKDTFVPELNGHPSWSPDGSQIVFWSNRTGNRQIWIMDADGSNLRSLSTTNHDDWNPVWIKYTDPARDPAPDIGGGFSNSP